MDKTNRLLVNVLMLCGCLRPKQAAGGGGEPASPLKVELGITPHNCPLGCLASLLCHPLGVCDSTTQPCAPQGNRLGPGAKEACISLLPYLLEITS